MTRYNVHFIAEYEETDQLSERTSVVEADNLPEAEQVFENVVEQLEVTDYVITLITEQPN